jgi:RNA polymerase sigma-70 factor (ECF subfamily)
VNATRADGEDRRFAALYDLHADAVFRLSLRLCGGCHAEAEDLAQDALIAALGSLPRFAGRSRITTWLYAVTVRTWRKRCERREPDTLPLIDGDGTSLPDGLDSQLTRLSIEAAIAALPEPLREAFVVVKSEGLTHREAAAVLGLPIGTVQARVHEAARRLRRALLEERGEEEK